MSFTAADARAFLATCRTPARCILCGAVDPPTRMALCYEPKDSAHLLVHDGCAEHTDTRPAAVVLASRKRLDADKAVAACEAVVALAERLDAAEAVVAAVRREHNARVAWLASLPPGSCASPPSQALLDAEAATRAALQGAP
jgi:hypothetical protein